MFHSEGEALGPPCLHGLFHSVWNSPEPLCLHGLFHSEGESQVITKQIKINLT